jgi:hypothetical protein
VRRDNHLLDCEVYSDACADPEWMPSLLLITNLSDRAKQSPKNENAKPQKKDADTRKRPDWFSRR